MKINTLLLNSLQYIREARRNALGIDPDVDVSMYKTRMKNTWEVIHQQYNIPTDLKLKVELDGELAGELRYKDGSVYMPDVTEAVPQEPNDRYGAVAPKPDFDPNRIVVINDDGLAIICESVQELLTHYDDCISIYRVAAR